VTAPDPPFDLPRLSRRAALRTGVYGAGAIALGGLVVAPALAGADPAVAATRAAGQPAATTAAAVGSYDFNQGWLFGGGYASGSERPGYDDGRFARVTVPHTVVPLSWTDWDYQRWQQRWIYRKHFDGAALTGPGDRVLLTFDGVMTDATVVLNGVTLATHAGGYLPFTAELTGRLKKGANVLAVIVDGRWLDVPPDALPGGPDTMDYLQPAGIYRDVTLQVVPAVYLADVFARPVNVLASDRAVRVEATIDAGAIGGNHDVKVTTELLTSAGVKRAEAATEVRLAGPGTRAVTLTIDRLGEVDYWSPERPALYAVRTTLSRPGGASHTVTTQIGFRQAVFETGGFFLNGSRYEIFGLNRHQIFPYLGMAAPARLQRRDALTLKNDLNVNMVRCSHYPQSPHFLDACDELGIMVWQEPPGWGFMGDAAFQQRFLSDVAAMVIRDRNRPSVVVWGTRLDETKNYPALYATARQLAYRYDGSRPTAGAVTFHSTGGWAEDVFSYDDYHIVDGEPELYPPVAGVPYLISEAVGAAVDPSYRWFDPPATLANQAYAHALVHDQAQADPRYAGVLAWAGIDYYSAPNPVNAAAADKNWRSMRTPGVLDVFRVPKPGASIYQSQIAPADRPVIIPAFWWDNASPPGANAMIATNCDRLELSVNGRPWLTVTPDAGTFGSLRYPPAFADLSGANAAAGIPSSGGLPDLRIDGYVGTRLAATAQMTADTSRDRLSLALADAEIAGDGSDATAVTVRVTDAYGNHRPGTVGGVALTLAGPATLIAANPFPLAALGGVGGGFIRSRPGQAGRVTLTATHAALERAQVGLTVTSVRSKTFI
jgi:beta-galactosidase